MADVEKYRNLKLKLRTIYSDLSNCNDMIQKCKERVDSYVLINNRNPVSSKFSSSKNYIANVKSKINYTIIPAIDRKINS